MQKLSLRLLSMLLVTMLTAACGGQGAGNQGAGGQAGAETALPTSPAVATTEQTTGPQETAGAPVTTAEATVAPTVGTGEGAAATAVPAEGGAEGEGEQVAIGTPPPVPNAQAASQYSGATLIYYGDTVGLGAQLDQALAQQFTADTGININVVPKPQSATENYATYQRFFQARSTDVDVMMLDVIWPAAFAPHLLDLSQALGTEAGEHYESIIQNNTVEGRLIAMPWFADFGMMYYRTDLLQKYGFSAPPRTWDELEQMAQTIQEGERQAGNANFQGFVWQGASYEGLTCNAVEWIAGAGGSVVQNGQIALNTPEAAEVLNKVAGFVGTISPQGVTSYQEEDARNIFQGGNAAFMRNWPYAYAAGNQDDSPIRGSFDVAPIPTLTAENQPVGTVGGWQLGVSAYSRNPEAAVEFVRYMTSPEVQRYRAIVGAYIPTIQSVAEDQEVLQALPFLENLADVQRVTRPSNELGENYNQGSTIIFQGVSRILQGQDAAQILPQVESQMQRFVRS